MTDKPTPDRGRAIRGCGQSHSSKRDGGKMTARILAQRRYKPGDQPPEGYLEWHEWAEVQHQAGIRQVPCGRCGHMKTPQELSDEVDKNEMQSNKGVVVVKTPVCKRCAEKK